MQRELDIYLRYERTGEMVNNATTAFKFPRSDTVILTGQVSGEVLTGLSAKATVRMINPDGTTGVTVVALTSAAAGGITITDLNPATKSITVELLKPADTAGFEPGQAFVFDVEVTRPSGTGILEVVRTIKGRLSIEEDYTLNA